MELFAPNFEGTRVDGVLNFDGQCWPNPGPSRCAFVLCMGARRIEKAFDLGHGTNNTAEFHGLLNGLKCALENGVTHLEVYGDSQLVINGVGRVVKGKKKPWKPHLEVLKVEARELATRFVWIEFNWVSREHNSEADALAEPTRVYP